MLGVNVIRYTIECHLGTAVRATPWSSDRDGPFHAWLLSGGTLTLAPRSPVQPDSGRRICLDDQCELEYRLRERL